LKRAYLAGFPHARYSLRRQQYEVDFKSMTQKNTRSGKCRQIRPPYRWEAPAAPITKPGPTTCIKVPEGAAGTTIHVPHPKDKSQYIAVDVPATAKAGQAMLVPVPALVAKVAVSEPAPTAPAPAPAPAAEVAKATPEKTGRSTAAKVCMGVGGLAAVGGVAVAGAILGEHIAEEGWDATMEELGDGFEAAGEAIVDGAEAAGEWIEGAAVDAGDWAEGAVEDAGDFIMDLF